MPELSTQECESRFWVRYGPYLFGQSRRPQTAQEWLDAARQIRGLQTLDELAERLETAATASQKLQQRQRVAQAGDIHYNKAGEPCCPIHERPLKQGKFGYFCSAKDERGKNGYCDFRAKDV